MKEEKCYSVTINCLSSSKQCHQ